jgi:hypothetical protein
LAISIATAATLVGTAVQSSTSIAVTKTIAMTALQKTLVTVSLTAAIGVGIFEARQASRLSEQNQALQQQQAPLAGQIAQLLTENQRLSNLVVQAKDGASLSQAQFSELLKLRGQSAQARTALEDLAKFKSSAAQQVGAMPAIFTNAMARVISISEKFKKTAALAKLDRMKGKLHLTDDQAQAIRDIMDKNIDDSSQQTLNAMMGKQTRDEETEIKSLLTSDQLAAYPGFKQAETIASAQNSAQADLTMMAGEMDLSQEQQDKARSALYQLNLNQATAPQNQDAIVQALASGKFADFINLQAETQNQTLKDKLKALDGILTPEQLKTYEQKRLEMIDMQTSAMKVFLPQTTNGVAR